MGDWVDLNKIVFTIDAFLYIVTRCECLDKTYFMHQSFVTPPPPPHTHTSMGKDGDSRAKVRDNYFSSVLAVLGKLRGFDIRMLSPGRFYIAKGGAKNKVLTSSLPPGGGAHSKAMKTEKS